MIHINPIKYIRTPSYNYDFDPVTGNFARWGDTKDDDPQYSPLGPEIADIEISTICHGINNRPCQHCYKSNTGSGKNMSLEKFKEIFAKLPKNLTQIAFGIGDLNGNPEMLEIFWHCRDNGVIPNVTINGWGLTPEWAFKLAEVCGAVAVSRYDDKNVCYDAVKLLTDTGLEQVNIHQLVAGETFDDCMETIGDMYNDSRLKDLNAIVFLSLKQKGRGEGYTILSQEKSDMIFKSCLDGWIKFGMDSCSASKFMDFLERHPKYEIIKSVMKKTIEPCESTLFSIYINVDGEVYPCSFCEGRVTGVSMDGCKEDFLREIWYGPEIDGFRGWLLDCGRRCPIWEA